MWYYLKDPEILIPILGLLFIIVLVILGAVTQNPIFIKILEGIL